MSKTLLIVMMLIQTLLMADWNEYKTRFIADDGRVIDKRNDDITHSEAVGYALYLAYKNKDLKTFNKVYRWYKDNLKKNDAGLIPWKWGKDDKGKWHVLDHNSATDGNLWIAYGNLLMYEHTSDENYKNEAFDLLKSIKEHLILKMNEVTFLLPAENGYTHEEFIEINLSYYLFFIFDKFKEYDNDTVWEQLKIDGVKLLQKAEFSSLQLPSDWIKVMKKDHKISFGRNNSFAYDAIRIPLNILKSDLSDKKDLLSPYVRLIEAMKQVNTVFGSIDLKEGEISFHNYAYAQLSVYNMIDNYVNHERSFEKKLKKMRKENKDDYYSYSIYLLTITD
jgi:endo-1,4-beta-D-glucanase Y